MHGPRKRRRKGLVLVSLRSSLFLFPEHMSSECVTGRKESNTISNLNVKSRLLKLATQVPPAKLPVSLLALFLRRSVYKRQKKKKMLLCSYKFLIIIPEEHLHCIISCYIYTFNATLDAAKVMWL